MITQHSPEMLLCEQLPYSVVLAGAQPFWSPGALPAHPAAAGCCPVQAAAALQGMALPLLGLALQGQ